MGFRPGKLFGAALVAMERGHFPVSHTGYRSVCGIIGSGPGKPEDVSQEFLDTRALEEERTVRAILKACGKAGKPEGNPIHNYIRISSDYQQAMRCGFFATDENRRTLWAAAFQLLAIVESDARFQPVPVKGYLARTKEICRDARDDAKSMKEALVGMAAGTFPKKVPCGGLVGLESYFELPPKPAGEPVIDLGGFVPEMKLKLPVTVLKPVRTVRLRSAPEEKPSGPVEVQLGFLDVLSADAISGNADPPDSPRSKLST
ncbi:MAG: hypothetical protein JWM32_3136 [Verrucomicrobia bacterium]|nr:hypothetical protein [Verrucomicrobiota bacterium]